MCNKLFKRRTVVNIVIVMLIVFIFSYFVCFNTFSKISTEEDISPLQLFSYDNIECEDKETAEKYMETYKQRMDAAHEMAEKARFLGYDEEHIIISSAQNDWQHAYIMFMSYENIYDNLQSQFIIDPICYDEYPVAAEVWTLLKDYGLSDYVCAGIVGNMMTECGGGTLNLKPYIYNPSGYYYGLCQWNRGAYPSVFDCDTEGQITFLMSNIGYELNTYGSKYYRGFNYELFLNLDDEQAVALAFAKCYERCGSSTYSSRQYNATVAYNYFVR